MGVAALLSKLGEKSRTSLILVRNYGTYNLEVRLSLYIEMHTQTLPATVVRRVLKNGRYVQMKILKGLVTRKKC